MIGYGAGVATLAQFGSLLVDAERCHAVSSRAGHHRCRRCPGRRGWSIRPAPDRSELLGRSEVTDGDRSTGVGA